MAASDEQRPLKNEIKLALVGDAGVGKTNWVSRLIGPEDHVQVSDPSLGYDCRTCGFSTNIGLFWFKIWDIPGSHITTPQERAEWIHDSDAAVIMIDLADQASIENAVYWHREILSSQKNSDESTSLPVLIYSCKVYEKNDKRAIDPTEISWPDEIGETPFFYNPYEYFAGPQPQAIVMEADRCEARPIGWILEQLSGQPNVEIIYFYPPDPPHSPLDPEYKRMKAEFKEQGNFLLPDEDDADL